MCLYQFYGNVFVVILGGKSKKPPGPDKELNMKSTHVSGRLTALAPIVDDIIHDEENMDKEYTDFHNSKGKKLIFVLSALFEIMMYPI